MGRHQGVDRSTPPSGVSPLEGTTKIEFYTGLKYSRKIGIL